MNYLHGVCKKAFKKKMQPFEGMFYEVEDQECGYDTGDTISVSLHDSCQWHDDVETHVYEIRINHQKVTLNRREIEELVEIYFEYGRYNACVKEGIPCGYLRGNQEGDTSRTRQPPLSHCGIHWEVGRGFCSSYHPEK